jgi:hypothetical protein
MKNIVKLVFMYFFLGCFVCSPKKNTKEEVDIAIVNETCRIIADIESYIQVQIPNKQQLLNDLLTDDQFLQKIIVCINKCQFLARLIKDLDKFKNYSCIVASSCAFIDGLNECTIEHVIVKKAARGICGLSGLFYLWADYKSSLIVKETESVSQLKNNIYNVVYNKVASSLNVPSSIENNNNDN